MISPDADKGGIESTIRKGAKNKDVDADYE